MADEYDIAAANVLARDTQVQHHLKDRPQVVRRGFAALIVIALLGYFSWQAWGLIKPPELTISYPSDAAVVYERALTVSGTATPDSAVTINDIPLLIEPTGQFSQTMNLHVGMNELVITARTRYGRPQEVTRTVYYRANEVVKGAVFEETH